MRLIRQSNQQGGFLLIEGLIGLGLLTIVGFAISNTALISNRTNTETFSKLWAQQIVINAMEDVSRISRYHSSISSNQQIDVNCYSIMKEIIPCKILSNGLYISNPETVYKLKMKVSLNQPLSGLKTIEYLVEKL